jgi:hypothetical protein
MLPAMDDPLGKVTREADAFLMRQSKVHRTLERIARAMADANADFAVAGALAVGEHGHLRLTVDVDLVVTPEGLQQFRDRWLGRGYVEKFPGSRGVRDSETGVAVDFLVTGEFPGDGLPKSVRFPAPGTAPLKDGIRVLDLRTLIELKLASGISAADRLQDLADVLALVRVNALDREYAAQLDPLVRDKYAELWQAAQTQRDL